MSETSVMVCPQSEKLGGPPHNHDCLNTAATIMANWHICAICGYCWSVDP